ncbi:MAG: hypothetical protein JJU35_15290, partial [Balneolales bacterium]|nr:hypothetical protein [Balneolales bacterium]
MVTSPHLPRPDALEWVHWGRRNWAQALAGQEARWQAVVDGSAPPALFSLEHEPVITLGRRAREDHLRVPREELARRGIEVVEADRGGEATYHGPGQLTLYAIVPIHRLGLGASDLVRALAEAIVQVLARRGVDAHYDGGRPGLWVEDRKICAV